MSDSSAPTSSQDSSSDTAPSSPLEEPTGEEAKSKKQAVAAAAAVVEPPRILRWVGQAPQYVRRLNRQTGAIELDVDYNFEKGREIPYSGTMVRSLRPPAHENDKAGLPGLSRTYHWGPQAPFLTEVLPADAALIQQSAVGGRFVDVTDHKGKLGSRSIKGYYRDGLVRRLDDPLHASSQRIINKRLGLEPKLVLPGRPPTDDDDEED